MEAPQISVVIPVYNNWWLTARCLRELERLRSSLTFETIVIDNGSSDETPHAIAAYRWLRYRRFESNRNFAAACNAGARMARSPVTLLLNNDAYPLGDAFTPLIRAFDREEVAVAGGALFFEDGVTQAAGLVVLPNAHWHYYCRNLPPELQAVTVSRDALGVSGAAMAVRTQWFVENDGFDESFVNGFEDVDLCLRAREQQRAIAYVADARFAHYEAASAGRYALEAQNERRFYERRACSMRALPRTARGSVGAILVQPPGDENALLAAARCDLEAALRAFGHPIVRNAVSAWRPFDRRFRQSATLAWFSAQSPRCGVAVERHNRSPASLRTSGAVQLEVPWLPCAAPARCEQVMLRRSDDAACRAVGVCGEAAQPLVERLRRSGYTALPIAAETISENQGAELACVIHVGLTDDSAFGNVLLAQAGLPAVAVDRPELRALFARDVAVFCSDQAPFDAIAQFVGDPKARRHYGNLVAADSRRRFSPRRSAVRIVDLLCAARFGLERPGKALRNTPL